MNNTWANKTDVSRQMRQSFCSNHKLAWQAAADWQTYSQAHLEWLVLAAAWQAAVRALHSLQGGRRLATLRQVA